MEEEKKETTELEWVPLKLAYDPDKDTVLLKTENKDDFAKAVGLLMRVSLQTTKDILMKEANGGKKE